MRQMSDAEAKWNLSHLYGVVDQEYKKSLDKSFKAFDTLDKIRDIVVNAEDTIKGTYGAVIVEGYADVFDKIREVLTDEY